MESKLMPCKCGGENDWACWKTSDGTYYLECEGCGYKTKGHKTVADAENEWDKRNGVPMNTSELTTGEIIELIAGSNYYYGFRGTSNTLLDVAINRLESQEQTISALTARAEQAERERDAVESVISEHKLYCFVCEHEQEDIDTAPCNKCFKGKEFINFKRRGLPQDGGAE